MSSQTSSQQWIEQSLAAMSIPELVGQMLVADFAAVFTHRAHENFQRLERILREQHVGGIILAGGNVLDIALLTNELQQLSKLPLLVNADLETGLQFFWRPWLRVRGRAPDMPAFLPGGGTAMPCMMAIGATRSAEHAYDAGRITALEARAMGIHWTNSPVLDVNNNPRNPIINTRSFGEDPQLVARLGAAYVQGCQSEGVIATVKHFPGHGDTSQDTHMQLPVMNFDETRLHAMELIPFKAAIGAGAKAVMTAHIALPQIDASKRPATLSRKIITELLREQLGFNGLVVTDAFTMQGITDHYGQEEAAVLAAQAGADMLLIPADTAKVHQRLVQAVTNGEVAREQIHAAVRRILTAKAELNLHVSRRVSFENIMTTVGAPESHNIAEKISAEALTLLEHDGRALPLRAQPPKKIFALVISNALQQGDGAHLHECLSRYGHQIDMLSFLHEPTPAALERALSQCREAELVLVTMYLSVGAWKGAMRIPALAYDFMNTAQAMHKPMLAVSFGDPYVFEHLPPMSASLCAYNGGRMMEGLVARALMGELDMHGKLPVTIPHRFVFGAGLEFKA